jgi:putative aminopeptidase FrvX
VHGQALTRGGSDASCAASRGLCARPVTLAFGAENSHGFEIMHRDAPGNLARLLVAYLGRLRESGALTEGNLAAPAETYGQNETKQQEGHDGA